MKNRNRLISLEKRITSCKECPRLVDWQKTVAVNKISRYNDWDYWGKPVPSFGKENAELLVVGLAPAAHGANRTGRIFTGDRSGEWLYRALYEFGFCNLPESKHIDDGLELNNCRITAALHCAPPMNKPAVTELNNCRQFLIEELLLLKRIKVIIALGKIAFDAVILSAKELKLTESKNSYKFSHGGEVRLKNETVITGKLTESMFNKIFKQVRTIIV